MIPNKNIYVSPKDFVELYVIGYKNIGESIVLNFANEVSGVVDCYKKDNNFIAYDLLNRLGVENLDFVCWTHPHDDHSKGLTKLFDFISDQTKFIMPEGISLREIISNLENYDQNNMYNKIFKLIEDKIKDHNFISANHYTNLYSINLKCYNSKQSAEIDISSFAPLSKLVKSNSIKTIKDILISNQKNIYEENNIYSIGLKIDIIKDKGQDNFSICLSGDIGNETLKSIPKKVCEKIFTNNLIFKIPHHCSSNSDSLLKEKSISYFDYGVTTAYQRGRSNLPENRMLSQYNDIGSVVSTTEKHHGEYGMVYYKIPIFNELNTIEVKHCSAAGRYK